MTRESLARAARFLAVAAVFAWGAGAPLAANAAPGDKPAKRQKPRQVHPTGEEDAKAPTAADIQGEAAVEQMTNRSTEGLAAVRHEGGMVSMDLEGRFMSVMVAVPGKDGKTVPTCVDSRDQLANKVKKARPQAPVLEEK